MTASKKKFVRNYLKKAGFYSYDAAAADEENPVMRWIGREVKRFLAEAHIHVPFLLRVAAAPAEMTPDMAAMANDKGELELEEDDELNLGQRTPEELRKEQAEEPDMMQNAERWDNFLALVAESNRPWASPSEDSDAYREGRAVKAFNLGARVANDIYALNPDLVGWVLHVLVFINPRQFPELGDPQRRACDACESFGSSCKTIIRHLTCRRRSSTVQKHGHRSADGKKLWAQTFSRGYIQQTFRRLAVRAELIHGEANVRYLQRSDYALKEKGKVAKEKAESASDAYSIKEGMEAPFVWSLEAALAVWA